MLAEIAAVLETTEANVNARLVGLRIAPVCSRCGGSGSYSFNQTDGSRCYGCNGSGFVPPKTADLPAMLEAAKATKADGRFDAYLRYMASRKVAKTADATVMNAWTATGISKEYNWRNAYGDTPNASGWVNPTFNQRDADLSAINKKMHDAYDVVSKATHKLVPMSPTYRDDVIALSKMVAVALATIEEANKELKAYLQNAN